MTEDQTERTRLPAATDIATEHAGKPREEPLDDAEQRVRRALGLLGERTAEGHASAEAKASDPPARSFGAMSPSRPPRRFVKDGEVPATILRARRDPNAGTEQPVTNRLAAAEAAASAERLARERAEQAHRGALETVRALETRQKHIELARDEALAALRAGDALLDSLQQALRDHQEQLKAAQTAIAASEQAVRAGAAALHAERAARLAAEAALRDARVAPEPREQAPRGERTARVPTPRNPAGKRKPARAPKATATRAAAASGGKPKAQRGKPAKASPRTATRKATPPTRQKARTRSRLQPTKGSPRTGTASRAGTKRPVRGTKRPVR